MAEFGFSIAGLTKAVNQLRQIKENGDHIEEKKYVVKTDAEAAPYGLYQEVGTRTTPATRFMRKARNQSIRESESIIQSAKAKSSLSDGDYFDTLLQEWAEFIKEKAREKAPRDTGRLAEGSESGEEGKGIHIIKNK